MLHFISFYLRWYIVIYACGLLILCSLMHWLYSHVFTYLCFGYGFLVSQLTIPFVYCCYMYQHTPCTFCMLFTRYVFTLISRLLFLKLPHFHYHLCISVSSQVFSSFHGCQARSYVHFHILKALAFPFCCILAMYQIFRDPLSTAVNFWT